MLVGVAAGRSAVQQAIRVNLIAKGIIDGSTSKTRALPLLSLPHKDKSLQMKVIENCVISIAGSIMEYLFLSSYITEPRMIVMSIKSCMAK